MHAYIFTLFQAIGMSIFDVEWLYQLNVFKQPVRHVRVNIERYNKRETNLF